MSLVVPNQGELIILQYMVNKTDPGDLILHLYKNDQSLAEDTVIGDLTESTEAGYAEASLAGASWSTALVSTNTATASHVEKTFSFTAAATVYGYYVTDNAKSQVLWAERFSGAPFVLPSGGGEIAITPKLTLD